MLVIATEGAPPPPRRRRMRARAAEPGFGRSLPLTRATAIRAFEPFAEEDEAARWLD